MASLFSVLDVPDVEDEVEVVVLEGAPSWPPSLACGLISGAADSYLWWALAGKFKLGREDGEWKGDVLVCFFAAGRGFHQVG